jgi:hypothetical protein
MSKSGRSEKTPEITEKWTISIGLAVTCTGTLLALVAIGAWSTAWWASSMNGRMTGVEASVAEMKNDLKTLLKQQAVAGPVKPGQCSVVNPGPYSMK